MDFAGKKVLIMGLGIQGGGAGVARFFAEKGAKVTVTDLKTKKQLDKSLKLLRLLRKPIRFILGKHREEDFKNADLVIRNPDVPRDSPYLAIARKNKVPIEMDESLFLRLCPKLQNVVGVTGTRGKTTTTHLIGAILKKAGFHTLLGGNLRGVATISLLDQVRPDSKIVLELSSWQLQGLDWDKISPHVAVITNIYPDHLNRYKDMKDYIADKKIIFKYQKKGDFLVLNRENKITRSFAKSSKSRVIWFSKADLFHLRDVFSRLRRGPQSACRRTSRLGDLGWSLKGKHNLENLAAAYQVAKIFKIDDKIIKEAVEEFKGVPYRLEEIATIDGVTYVNDTTSTMPEATIAALKAYEGKPIILIAGGSSKKLDLGEMAKEIGKRVKAVVLLEGKGTEELELKIKKTQSKIATPDRDQDEKLKILGRFDTLKEAVLTAKDASKPRDIVLLSPGFASFGMFVNEFDRGEKFNEIVFSLKK